MATESEVKSATDALCEKMSDVQIGDGVKQEVASASLVMECCFVAAEGLVGDTSVYQIGGEHGRIVGSSRRTQDKQEIALALFDSVVKRSLMAQTQSQLQIIPSELLRQN